MNPADRTGERIDDLGDELDADVLAAPAELAAAPPPPGLRERLLARATGGGRGRVPAEPATPAELYEARSRAMVALLGELTPGDWARPAAPYAWSVHELLAHLTVIEELTVRQFALGDEPPLPVGHPSAADHLAMGADVIAALAAAPPEVTVARWMAASAAVAAHVRSDRFDPAAAVPLHGWPFDAATALVARSFEIWAHGDDIRRATGRPLDTPAPAELRTMSATSVLGLPLLLAVAGEGATLTPTRVVLTGAGGATFDLGPSAAADPGPDGANLLVADVVEYCRLVARRVEPGALAGTRTGDGALLDALLRAAQLIAV